MIQAVENALGQSFGEPHPELWDLTHNPWVVLQTVSGKGCRVLLPTRISRQLGRLPVKSERRSLGMGATQREGVRGGSPPAFHPKFQPKTSADF
jgi:hypothetical protein